MPQAAQNLHDEMRRIFGGSVMDFEPWDFLMKAGFKEKAGMLSKPKCKLEDITQDEFLCVQFLIHEWDYGWQNS